MKAAPSCRDLLAVPPRHRSMGPLSVVLGGARPWWPYRLLDLLLVIITALMTGHTGGNIKYDIIISIILSAGPVMGQGPGLYTLDINSKAGEGIFVTYFQVRYTVYCH